MTQTLVRFLVGGALVALLPVVAQRMGPYVAGTLLLFPAVSFAGLMFVGLSEGVASIEKVSLAAAWSLPTVLAFLVTVHVAARNRLPLQIVLSVGVVAWCIVSAPFVWLAVRRQT